MYKQVLVTSRHARGRLCGRLLMLPARLRVASSRTFIPRAQIPNHFSGTTDVSCRLRTRCPGGTDCQTPNRRTVKSA